MEKRKIIIGGVYAHNTHPEFGLPVVPIRYIPKYGDYFVYGVRDFPQDPIMSVLGRGTYSPDWFGQCIGQMTVDEICLAVRKGYEYANETTDPPTLFPPDYIEESIEFLRRQLLSNE